MSSPAADKPTSVNADGIFEPFPISRVPMEEFLRGERFGMRYRHLSSFGGGTQVSVSMEELPPGRQANQAHYHLLQEEHLYLIEGSLYQVEKLDFDGRKAYVRQIDCDYYTDAITYTKVAILDTFAIADVAEHAATQPLPAVGSHGEVHVASRVVGFKKIKFYTNENVGSGELDLPEQQMHTTSYWLTLSRMLMTSLPFSLEDRRDGVAGLAFAMKQVAQLLLMCDRQDLGLSIGAGDEGAVTDAGHVPDDLDEPRIFLYDSYPGGIGFSEPLFGMHDALLADTRRLIAGCPCDHGCPTCVGPAGESGARAKAVSLAILNRLLDGVPA